MTVASSALGVGEGIAGHRDDRDTRRPLVKDPDRFEAAHMRHKDIDQHHVEGGLFESAHAGISPVGNGDIKTLALEIDLDGSAHHGVVIDHENTRHEASLSWAAGQATPMGPCRN